MAPLTLRTLDGETTALGSDTLDTFAGSLRGELITPDAPEYDELRAIWNAMIDRRPGLIARCAGPADVSACVRLAREHGLLISVRGAGHNIAGNALADGALLIDLSAMTSVRVDTRSRRARVEPGVTLGDLDRETQAHGLATPVGINSTTGIAGLTLGGGFGWLSRKHGLTVDNLLSADVVLADGSLVHADETENADLFWAIRGGGGNFGIVTSFEFQLHPVGPELLAGLVVHPFDAAGDVMRHWRGVMADAPDELACWTVLRQAPPLPFLPEEVHGTEVLVLAMIHAGDMMAAEEAMRPLREYGDPIADVVAPHRYVDFQTAFDPLLTPGARNYWKSHDFRELSDAAIDLALEYTARLPDPQSEIFFGQLGGAVNRVPADATAYPARDVEYVMNVHCRWDDPAKDDACVGWAREYFDAMAPHATGDVYINFMTEDEQDRVRAAYAGNYDRLAELKAKYDPTNLFRKNQNIRPAPQVA